GKLGTTSASPSIPLAFAAASRLASISLINSIERSICPVVIDLIPPECSTCSSRGTRCAQTFKYAAGCCFRTFSIAAAPCFLKSAASASRKSLLNDLRVASNDPPGFPTVCPSACRDAVRDAGDVNRKRNDADESPEQPMEAAALAKPSSCGWKRKRLSSIKLCAHAIS